MCKFDPYYCKLLLWDLPHVPRLTLNSCLHEGRSLVFANDGCARLSRS